MTTRLKWMVFVVGTAVVVSTLALWFLWLGPEPRVLIVGSTTTTQDTGLLDVLQGEYTRQTGRPLRIVVAGAGAGPPQRRGGGPGVPPSPRPARAAALLRAHQSSLRSARA